jgi:hypothetical protein
MLLIKLWIGALLLVAPLANAASYCSPPDSTVVSRSRLLTINAPQSSRGSVWPTIGYEWGVRERWGVRTLLGYEYNEYRISYTNSDLDGNIETFSTRYRNSALMAKASLNYYFQTRKPALVGWFAGAGLLARVHYDRRNQESPFSSSEKNTGVAVRPIVMAGRHWALGRRWLLDTHLGAEFYTLRNYNTNGRALYADATLGLGVGYRF